MNDSRSRVRDQEAFRSHYDAIDWSDKAPAPPKLAVERKSAVGKFGCNVRPPFKKHFSLPHGRVLTSWDDYQSANQELGLVDTGRKPEMHSVPKLPESRVKGKHAPQEND